MRIADKLLSPRGVLVCSRRLMSSLFFATLRLPSSSSPSPASSSSSQVLDCPHLINFSMKRTLLRYDNYQRSSDAPLINYKPEEEDCTEVDLLKNEISKLQEKHLQMQGKGLNALSLKELQHLEQQLNVSLISVRERKELLLTKQLEESRLKEQRAELENETLRRQVQELRSFLPSFNQQYVPSYITCFAIDPKNSPVNNSGLDDTNYSLQKTNSDTTLQLGLPGEAQARRIEGNRESPSSDSVTTSTTKATPQRINVV
ncbi:agamous-like MADS-box protein AGL15 isoform X4 [Brassica rapa]|uniref:agamous-like MADS-box protein AGL15 isoform X4 n=1 Tax=Brassica campestris TaxID=3711 RepID=UPI00142E5CB9|nr:agamous-like MADS-box protein AGL15 isoform X4 [Brassica rapa]